IQRAGYYDLPHPQALCLLNKFEGSGEHCRLQHLLKKIIRKESQPILRFALVTCEKEVIENFSTILVRDCKEGKTQNRGGAFLETAEQARLVASIEPERMNQISADQ